MEVRKRGVCIFLFLIMYRVQRSQRLRVSIAPASYDACADLNLSVVCMARRPLSALTHKHTRIFIYFKDKGRACQASCGCWLCVDLAAALEKEGTRWQTAACLSVPSSSYNTAHAAAKYIKTQHLNFTAAIL